MKKLIALLLVITMLFSVIACKAKNPTSSSIDNSEGISSETVQSDEQSEELSEEQSSLTQTSGSLISTVVSAGSQTSKNSSKAASVKPDLIKPSTGVSDMTASGTTEAVLPKANQTGKTVTMLTWQDPKSEEIVEMVNDFTKYTGGKIEFLPTNWGEIAETATKLVMAGNGPDVTLLRNVDNPVMMYKGVLKELDNLISFSSKLWEGMEFYNAYLKASNKRYMAAVTAGVQEVLWYNTTIFENSEFDSPQVLYDKGELDYDQLLLMAKELTITKDGATTQYGLGAHAAGEFGNCIIAANLLDFVKKSGDIYVNNLSDSKIAESMTFLYDLYNTHKVMNPDASSLSNFVKGKLAMYVAPGWIALTDPIKSMHKKKQITYSLLPKAKGQSNTINWVDFTMYGITKNAKNPEGGAALINMLRFNSIDKTKIEEGRARSRLKGFTDKEMDYNNAGLKYSKSLDFLGFGDMGILMWGAMFYMASEGTTWNTSRETYIPEADKYIDTINGYLAK